jgi:hypothetical protein
MAVIKCAFHNKNGAVTVTPEVSLLTPGDKIEFNDGDQVVVNPVGGLVNLVVNHALKISAQEEGSGDKKRFVVSFDARGGSGDPTGPG